MDQLAIDPFPSTKRFFTSGDLPPIRDGIDMAKLVGRPHLFGRIKALRHGITIEPVANMVMQPDGRVTGHGHPNEGRWSPYVHSDLPAEETFSFVSGAMATSLDCQHHVETDYGVIKNALERQFD